MNIFTILIDMKILQIGDLHLGKTLYDFSLLENQKNMLEQLQNVLLNGEFDVLVLPGDIYDRAVPPAEAVELLDDFLTSIHKKMPNLYIIMISGNHDSASRLSFAKELLQNSNIYIETETDHTILATKEPIILQDKNGLKVAFYLLPFIRGIETEFVIKEFSKKVQDEFKNFPSVLISHCLILGSETSSSERIFVGTAENLNSTLLSNFTFSCLGHIHKPQKVLENAYYSGSPLAYSFDEIKYEKSFLQLEINSPDPKELPKITKIPVKPLRNLRILTDSFDNFVSNPEYRKFSEDYIEFVCTDDSFPLQAAVTLQKIFPYFTNIKLAKDNFDSSASLLSGSEIKQKIFENANAVSIGQVFSEFIADIYGEDADFSKEKQLLEQIAQELE